DAGDRARRPRLRGARVWRVALEQSGDGLTAQLPGDRALVAGRGRSLQVELLAVHAVDVAGENPGAVRERLLLEPQLAAERPLRVREVHELTRLLDVEGGAA